MKQLLVLSGKGGTGKTTIAAAMIKLSKTKVYADCDVDAPNLHLLTVAQGAPKRKDFIGMPKAVVDNSLCTKCNRCLDLCRFDAVDYVHGEIQVNQFKCEGCGLCAAVCPSKAIEMVESQAGELYLYDEVDYFSTAELKMGSGTSGKLVSEVKKQLRDYTGHCQLTVIDGSPGIGCPVIASVSGVDMVMVVAEPTLSGISDMKRILETANHFNTKAVVCVNKADVNTELTEEIQAFCQEANIPYVGDIPYDREVIRLLNEGKSIVDAPCLAGTRVESIYKATLQQLYRDTKGENNENSSSK